MSNEWGFETEERTGLSPCHCAAPHLGACPGRGEAEEEGEFERRGGFRPPPARFSRTTARAPRRIAAPPARRAAAPFQAAGARPPMPMGPRRPPGRGPRQPYPVFAPYGVAPSPDGQDTAAPSPDGQDMAEPPSERTRWVQSCLNSVLGLSLDESGIMDAPTRSAIRSFQQQQHLRVDGIAGPPTEAALAAACAAAPPPPGESEGELEEESGHRNTPEYRRWVQASLNQLQGSRLTVDGIIGPLTRSAIRTFQQRHGLAVDGVVGPNTEAALIHAGAHSPPRARPHPPVPPSPGGAARPCPETSPGMATDRCVTPGKLACPAIPTLLCVSNVAGIAFEYPTRVEKAANDVYVVRARKTVSERFIPSVGTALAGVVGRLAGLGMQLEAILTAGSLYCRCISGTDTLSNHSFGDAIDVVGIRWRGPAGTREVVAHSYRNPGERQVLRRINACLRLSFATVIDYHRADHRDHFHCDMNRGGGRIATGKTTVVFVQEALNALLGLSLPETGRLDAATLAALSRFSGRSAAELKNRATLNRVLDDVFLRMAQG
jgi:peptidoglycan hydrolase-like protein with peptidoglycan-binding domain